MARTLLRHGLGLFRQLFMPSYWANIGLQTKMGILVATGLTALVGIFGFLGVTTVRETVDRALQERVLLAQVTASHLDYVLDNVGASLRVAAEQEPLTKPDFSPELRHKVLRQVMAQSGQALRHVLLLDTEGRVLDAEPALPADLALHDVAAQIQTGANRIVLNTQAPYLGVVTIMAIPLHDSSGRLVGALAACFDLSWPEIRDFLSILTLGNTGYLEIVDDQGLILLSTRPGQLLTKADHSESLVAMIQAGQAKVTTCHTCHISTQGPERWPETMAFAPLKKVPWGVVLRQAQEETFASSQQLQGRIVFLGVIAVIGAMVLVWLTTRGVIAPVQGLTAAAQRIASGDLDTPIPVKGRDEIGTLARTLDDMRSRLRVSIAQIQELNLELDRRVQERTRECLEAQEILLQRNRELAALNAVAMAITRPMRLGELLEKALQEVLHTTGMDAGAIFLLKDETGRLELGSFRGVDENAAQAMIRIHMGDGDCAGVIEKGRPVVIPDLSYHQGKAGVSLQQAGLRSMVHVPLVSRGVSFGTLCVGTREPHDFSQDKVDLLTAIAHQIAVGIENARLYAELAHREQLRGELLQKVITAQEEERKRIARDLHDDTSQALTALIYSLETLESTCPSAETRASLSLLRQRATQILDGVHKIIYDLRPSMLDHLGLFAALRWYAETRLQPLGVRLHVEERGDLHRLPPQTETALFRVVQEAINNIAKHAGARNVRLTFYSQDGILGIDVEDDGIGFNVSEVTRSADQYRGLGLVGMQERVGLLGGNITITSVQGLGTQVSIRVPLEVK